MPLTSDGVRAAALQEKKAHPLRDDGKPVTAWDRRAATLEKAVAEVNSLRADVEELRQEVASLPFPFVAA